MQLPAAGGDGVMGYEWEREKWREWRRGKEEGKGEREKRREGKQGKEEVRERGRN